jgi:transcriptional regulator with XRE-family HTH domain
MASGHVQFRTTVREQGVENPTGELTAYLKQKREGLGLTQKQLAKLAGVPEYHVEYLEQGKIKRPTAKQLRPIMKALGEPMVEAAIRLGYVDRAEIYPDGNGTVNSELSRELDAIIDAPTLAAKVARVQALRRDRPAVHRRMQTLLGVFLMEFLDEAPE